MTPSVLAAAAVLHALVAGGVATPPSHHRPPPPQRASYELKRPGLTGRAAPDHAVAGFAQRARLLSDGRTVVDVVVQPRSDLHAATARSADAGERPADVTRYLASAEAAPAVEALGHDLSAEASGSWDASLRILQWVADNVRHEERDAPSTAAEALELRRGSCVGRSALAVALLRVAGLPARSVHGLLVPRDAPRGSVLGSAEFTLHRHVEVWLDGAGWVPSDPGHALGGVDSRHVVLAVEGDGWDPEAQRELLLRVVAPAEPLEVADAEGVRRQAESRPARAAASRRDGRRGRAGTQAHSRGPR